MKRFSYFFLCISAFWAFEINLFVVTAQPSLSDIQNHRNQTAIEYLQANGVVFGYADGKFRPGQTINRAEFMKIVIEAQFEDEEIENCIEGEFGERLQDYTYYRFPDVNVEAWYAKYICVGVNQEIVNGYPDGTFKPSREISFVEAAKVIANTWKFEVEEGEVWYQGYVEKLAERKAVPDDIPAFDHLLTRGQMSEMIYRLRANITDQPTLTYAQLKGEKIADNSQIITTQTNCETFEKDAQYLRDVYVAPSGSDSNSGSQSKPYQTLKHALKNAQPGDIIHVAAGNYGGGNYVSGIQGTAQNPIKILGPDDGEAVFSGGSEVFHMVNPAYIIISNLTFTGSSDNGINFDDGGDYTTPAHHIIFDNIKIHNVGSGGNNDSLKLSGVDNFYIFNSDFRDGSSGGSGIDMVGCHDGLIAGNTFYSLGSNFIQMKGGTSDIVVRDNFFEKVIHRGVNMGGSTGEPYFRPSIESGTDYEAKNLQVIHNTFVDVNSGVAFVGCDNCIATHNVIYKPRAWAFRILQETKSLGGVDFIPSRNGTFSHNIIVFDSSFKRFVNVGPNTNAESFTFEGNLWYSDDNPDFDYTSSSAELPAPETNGIYQENPQFVDTVNYALKASSPMADVFDDVEGECAEIVQDIVVETIDEEDVSEAEEAVVEEVYIPQTSVCEPLDETVGEVIEVNNYSELKTAVQEINNSGGNKTVLITDGTYNLDNGFWVTGSNVIFRSKSGNRDKVILKGKGMTGGVSHVFWAVGSNITIADLTIGEVANHAIQVMGESSRNAENLKVHNVRIYNTGEQMLKGSADATGGSDNGMVECSLFEYTDKFGPQYYIGGIDVHRGKNWQVSRNTFKNIRSPSGSISEHAIHFWSDSQDILVEKNTIINCDRGIGFGLGDRGTSGGIIKNNMIYNDGTGNFDDVGIGLENAANAKVFNNTIFHEQSYPNAIEYRFAGTDAQIYNNLTNKKITERNGGSADLSHNVTNAETNWFEDVSSGDLHLQSAVSEVIDQGLELSEVSEDIDGENRSDDKADVGADEV